MLCMTSGADATSHETRSRKYSNNFLFFNEMLMNFLFLMKLYDCTMNNIYIYMEQFVLSSQEIFNFLITLWQKQFSKKKNYTFRIWQNAEIFNVDSIPILLPFKNRFST